MSNVFSNVTDILSQARDHKQWLISMRAKQSDVAYKKLIQALDAAKVLYGDSMLQETNELLFNHALASAALVDALELDHEAVMATLLIGVPSFRDDWKIWLGDIFGHTIADVVAGVYQLQKLTVLVGADGSPTQKIATDQTEIFRKMFLAMADDIRVVLIKLAWRTQTIYRLSDCKDSLIQRRIAAGTLAIFAPLANRLGIWQIKWFLEDQGFLYTDPVAYQKIADLLQTHHDERLHYIAEIVGILRQKLTDAGIQSEVTGRPKHIFSIWKKMNNKQLNFSDLYDLFAVRVLVESTDNCYAVLALVHHLWQPILSEFNDYIAKPKNNDYRSLHTAVIGPENRAVEVQIRTHAMHTHAELGVAAHWRYKEGGASESMYEQKIAWLRQLLSWREEIFNVKDTDASKDFKTALFADTIYVLTPAGRVLALPANATPIDFAYAVHTDIGHRCRGAKIEGHIVPLSTTLSSGQRIEILTTKEGGPSVNWLHEGWVKSHRAISKIRHYIRQQNIESARVNGKQILDKECSRHPLLRMSQQTLAEKMGFPKLDALYIALGQEKLKVHAIARVIAEEADAASIKTNQQDQLKIKISKINRNTKGILIEGVSNLSTVLAKCCRPAPPDSIVGFVTKSRGASIHRSTCIILKRLSKNSPERLLKASWGDELVTHLFPINFEIIAVERPGLLRDISNAFSLAKLNVIAFNTVSQNIHVKLIFTVEVHHVEDLKHSINVLLRVNNVIAARRV